MTNRVGWKWPIIGLSSLIFIIAIIGFIWDFEPDTFDVRDLPQSQQQIVGTTTTATVINLVDVMLNKRGGFLSNDVLPPGVWMDNIPSWEYGVLIQVRDFTRVLRKDLSRSQSQSLENDDLKIADPRFNYDRLRWFPPTAESNYQTGVEALQSYLKSLQNADDPNTQFYARADNLREWLRDVEKRLGSLSQRLSASVGQQRENTDLAGDAAAQQSTTSRQQFKVKTPWLEIDNVFYEARGTCWALIHLLKAIEIDFAEVLQNKNAKVSLRQIIRELEATQESVWSPMILNGSGFGFLANHSLVMASYVSRANAAIIDLRELLSQG